jgi:AraC-like DNA-binding protein/tetratricopeptide (TPR) repeat protein
MANEPLPRSLKKAIERLKAEPGRPWRLCDLAAACGVTTRTLQKHFQRFLRCTFRPFIRELRFEQARRELLADCRHTTVTDIATRCGLAHLGRFAAEYRRRYGESPSSTRRRAERTSARSATSPLVLATSVERPTIAILPFNHVGPQPSGANAFVDEIRVELWRLNWLRIAPPPHARYHLRGNVREDGRGGVRVTVRLSDALSGRCVWALGWDGDCRDPIGFEQRIAGGVARAIQPALRTAEVERACSLDRSNLTAWELTMRALPCVTSIEAAAEGMALELLYEAMERAPRDPLPISIAAWCHGLRAGHHFAARPEVEKAAARELAARAARINAGDPLAETMLAAGYTLAHDLEAAAVHSDRALALDGGSAWAWGRSAWVKAYRGRAQEAIEEFHIARSLAPVDVLNFLWSVGIASAEFQMSRYGESISWFKRALAENPASTWTKRFLAPAYVLAGRMDEASHTLADFTATFPDLTITDIRSSLPWNASYLDRVSQGLETAGMRP